MKPYLVFFALMLWLPQVGLSAPVCAIKNMSTSGRKLAKPELLFIDLSRVVKPSRHNLSLFDSTWISQDLLVEYDGAIPLGQIDFVSCAGKPWSGNPQLVVRSGSVQTQLVAHQSSTASLKSFRMGKDPAGRVRPIESLRLKLPSRSKVCLGRVKMMLDHGNLYECSVEFAKAPARPPARVNDHTFRR